jgi:hypothetical protein
VSRLRASLTILVSIVTIFSGAILVLERQRSDFHHEGVTRPSVDAVSGQRVCEWEIGRGGLPRHVGVAPCIHRDAIARVPCAAAQVSGVSQLERGGPGVKAQLADEGILKPSQDAVGGQRMRERGNRAFYASTTPISMRCVARPGCP